MSSGFVPPGVQPQFAPPAPAPVDRMRSVPTLGLLMMVHGGLVLAWVLFCVFAIGVGLINVSLISPGTREDWIVIGVYSAFAIGALPAAVLGLVSGYRVRRLASRKLAFVALIVGGASFFCGNVFCMPFTVGLSIYGITVLTDARVRAAFVRVAAGESADALFHEAGVAP